MGETVSVSSTKLTNTSTKSSAQVWSSGSKSRKVDTSIKSAASSPGQIQEIKSPSNVDGSLTTRTGPGDAETTNSSIFSTDKKRKAGPHPQEIALKRQSKELTRAAVVSQSVYRSRISTPIHPGTSPPPSTSRTPEAATPPETTSVDDQPDPFKDPIVLPNTKKTILYVYPYSSSAIGKSHLQRFSVVVNMLRQNVENTPELRAYISEIDYTLKMCGPSQEESQPSIIVFCRKAIFAKLYSVLTSPHVACQYYLQAPSKLGAVLGRLWRYSTEVSSDSHLPRYKIFFWFSTSRPRILYWGKETVNMQMSRNEQAQGSTRGLALCGSKIILDSQRQATLGCILSLGPLMIYGITAQHAFESAKNEMSHSSPESEEEVQDDQRFSSPTSALAWEDAVVDDIEYDLSEHQDAIDDADQQRREIEAVREKQHQVEHPLDLRFLKTTVMFPSLELDHSDEADLDWALIEITQPASPLAGAEFLSTRDLSFPSHVALECPHEHREVVILTNPQRRGTLLCGKSFLGGINYPSLMEVWSVIISNGHCLVSGDSGSLVVDASTGQFYGHVVASNPFGEACVVPLNLVIKQINKMIPNSASMTSLLIRKPHTRLPQAHVRTDYGLVGLEFPLQHHSEPDIPLKKLKATNETETLRAEQPLKRPAETKLAPPLKKLRATNQMEPPREKQRLKRPERTESPPPLKTSEIAQAWTTEEEQRLQELRDCATSWTKIAQAFPSRTEDDIKKHWYKDMHYAEFAEDESAALLKAIKEYDANKWKTIGRQIGKPAKACEIFARKHFQDHSNPIGDFVEASSQSPWPNIELLLKAETSSQQIGEGRDMTTPAMWYSP